MAIDSGVLAHATEHYTKHNHEIFFKDGKIASPVLALMEARKEQEGMGRKYIIRCTTSEGSAVAADPAIADAIAGDGAAGGRPTRVRWEVSPVSMDAPFVFTRDDISQMSGMSKSKQFDVITQEMDLAVTRIRNRMAYQVSGKGWGLVGQTTAQTTSTFTLPVWLVNRLKIGDRLVASVTEDTDVLLGSAAQLRVDGINPSTGVVTLSGNPVTTWANNAALFIFMAGDRAATDPNGADSAKLCVTGLKGWIDPTSTTLFGLARTGNAALTGHDVDCTGLDTKDACIEIAERLFQNGKKADTVFVSGRSWKLLQRQVDSQKIVEVKLGQYQIGFDSIKVPTVFGMIDVIPDPFIEAGEAYCGPFRDSTEAPYIAYSDENLINLDDLDGLRFQRQNANGARQFKGQFYFRGNVIVPGPGNYAKGSNLPTT